MTDEHALWNNQEGQIYCTKLLHLLQKLRLGLHRNDFTIIRKHYFMFASAFYIETLEMHLKTFSIRKL